MALWRRGSSDGRDFAPSRNTSDYNREFFDKPLKVKVVFKVDGCDFSTRGNTSCGGGQKPLGFPLKNDNLAFKGGRVFFPLEFPWNFAPVVLALLPMLFALF